MVFPLGDQLWTWWKVHFTAQTSRPATHLLRHQCDFFFPLRYPLCANWKCTLQEDENANTHTWKIIPHLSSHTLPFLSFDTSSLLIIHITFPLKFLQISEYYVIIITWYNIIMMSAASFYTHFTTSSWQIWNWKEKKPLRVWTKFEQRNTFVSGGFKRLKH